MTLTPIAVAHARVTRPTRRASSRCIGKEALRREP